MCVFLCCDERTGDRLVHEKFDPYITSYKNFIIFRFLFCGYRGEIKTELQAPVTEHANFNGAGQHKLQCGLICVTIVLLLAAYLPAGTLIKRK